MTATIEGRTYEIPELWMVGFCRHGATVETAVRYWYQQQLMQEEFESVEASAGAPVDAILRTSVKSVALRPTAFGAEQSKAIRDLFRELGWSKFFRVTKGCWSLGASIEWAKGFRPSWVCDRQRQRMEEAAALPYFSRPGVCCYGTCKRREAQRFAVARRVHAALNAAFKSDREFGDRSDIQSDYFDSDYTFHA